MQRYKQKVHKYTHRGSMVPRKRGAWVRAYEAEGIIKKLVRELNNLRAEARGWSPESEEAAEAAKRWAD